MTRTTTTMITATNSDSDSDNSDDDDDGYNSSNNFPFICTNILNHVQLLFVSGDRRLVWSLLVFKSLPLVFFFSALISESL